MLFAEVVLALLKQPGQLVTVEKKALTLIRKDSVQQLTRFSFFENNTEEHFGVDTIVNGVLETSATAKTGDFVFCGPLEERYVLPAAIVSENYTLADGGSALESIPVQRVGVELPVDVMQQFSLTEADMAFESSRGLTMVAAPGDYILFEDSDLLVQRGAQSLQLSDVARRFYRVERRVLEETYRVI